MDESNVGERSIASLLHKETLMDGISLYSYVNSIIGYYDQNTKIFVDEQGNIYNSIDSENGVNGVVQFYCGNATKIDEAYNKYLDKKDEKDEANLKIKYNSEEMNHFYLSLVNEDNILVNIKYDINEEYEKYYKNTKPKINRESKTSEVDSQVDYAEIEKMLKNRKYTKKELLNLKEELLTEQEDVKKILRLTDKVLKERYKKPVDTKNKYFYDDGVLNITKTLKDIKKTIVAQDEPIRKVLAEICRFDMNDKKRYGIILSGSYGVGKKELLKLLSKDLQRPLMIIDSTQINPEGYEGMKIENYIAELYNNCGGDLKKVQKAIIYFDKLDKKISTDIELFSNPEILKAITKFTESTSYKAMTSAEEEFNIKTNKMIVVVGGEFQELYTGRGIMGFHMNDTSKKSYPNTSDLMEKSQMTKDFLDAFPIYIRMNDLTEKDYIDSLKKSKKSPINTEKRLFKRMNCKIDFTEDAYELISKKAYVLKQGHNGLRTVVKNSTSKAFEDVNNKRNKFETITITADTVDDNSKYTYVIRKNTRNTKKGAK